MGWITSLLILLHAHTVLALLPLQYNGYGCEMFTIQLYCPEGYYIAVTSAIYGRNDTTKCTQNTAGLSTTATCRSERALQEIQRQCDGRTICEYLVNGTSLGNPCPGISGYLDLSYECRVPVYSGKVCEENKVPLQCNINEVINIEDVNFGRRDLQTCTLGGRVTQANCSSPTAKSITTALCNNRQTCDFLASTNFLGDPCLADPNYMDIAISCLPCKNEYGNQTQCESWKAIGECERNPRWMMAFCRQTCTLCNLHSTCTNEHVDDDECDAWASRGECTINPDYMRSQCRRSCNQCRDTSLATNTPENVASSSRQAFTCDGGNVTLTCPPGRHINIRYLHYGRSDTKLCPNTAINSSRFCRSEETSITRAAWLCNGRSSCLINALPTTLGDPCPGVFKYLQLTYTCESCTNIWPYENNCTRWASSGECSNNREFMLAQCYSSCSECARSDNCANVVNDDACDGWALSGECVSNPRWMQDNCRRSCRVCNYNTATSTTANTPTPSPTTTTKTTTTTTTTTTSRPTTTTTTTTTSRPTSTSACVDNYINPEMCRGWAEVGICDLSESWMKQNCYKTCTGCAGGKVYARFT